MPFEMNIESEKKEFIKWLESLSDEGLVHGLTEWKRKITEEYYMQNIVYPGPELAKKQLDEAAARVKSGQFTSHEEVIRLAKKW
jgi:hypothetical protein